MAITSSTSTWCDRLVTHDGGATLCCDGICFFDRAALLEMMQGSPEQLADCIVAAAFVRARDQHELGDPDDHAPDDLEDAPSSAEDPESHCE